MRDDGCCAIDESCSEHYNGFISVVVLIVIGTIAFLIFVVYCVDKYLEERKMDRQLEREGVKI